MGNYGNIHACIANATPYNFDGDDDYNFDYDWGYYYDYDYGAAPANPYVLEDGSCDTTFDCHGGSPWGRNCCGDHCVTANKGTCFGKYCSTNNGGQCVGVGCTTNNGGDCYGDGCETNNGGDCYGVGCKTNNGGRKYTKIPDCAKATWSTPTPAPRKEK